MIAILSESRVDAAILKFIDEMFPSELYPYQENTTKEDGSYDYESFDESWCYYEDEDCNCVFTIRYPSYWNPNDEKGMAQIENSPILYVEEDYEEKLNQLFGDRWKPVLKAWFENKTGEEIKSVGDFFDN